MDESLTPLLFWAAGSFLGYFALQVPILQVENEYLEHFQQPKKNWKDIWLSTVVGVVSFLVLGWLTRLRLPASTVPCVAMAAASLVGTWRVDRRLLLIPERYQLLGLVSGLLYTAALLVTGEHWISVFSEVGFGWLLVGLLWLLSHLYFRIRGTIGFGFGDVKLLAWLAFFNGKRMADVVLVAMALGISALALSATNRSLKARKLELPRGQDAFAFGPCIVLAVLIESLYYYG